MQTTEGTTEQGTEQVRDNGAVEISAREGEVLALLGDHLSNAEIGAKLYISVRTVESHVSSLLRKLELPDRRALAQRAAELARADRSQPAPVLPAPLTSFVGRAGERAELAEMIKLNRQVTALGPGGVGKTRLALAVAADVAGQYPDGVWFVDLVPIADPAMVGAAVAAALGLGEQPGRGLDESVVDALADRHALLVLDNCEQVRDGVAPFLERLLATCPRLTVLATSRARLMVPFERVYPVPSLSLAEGGESDAVALFMDRAAAVGRPPDPALHVHIAAVCARLDGMALAIELAAARLPTLGLDGLAAALSDPLRMLAGGSRADDRHRSVRAALDWSHALLEPEDRALLRRVSVFVAPFTASQRFLDAWRRAGSPARSYLAPAVAGVATIHGMRGDEDARREWDAILGRLGVSQGHTLGYGAVFDGMLLLHHGQASEAVERLAPEPAEVWRWVTWIWHHWYVALRAEAAVLAGTGRARDRVDGAAAVVVGNPVAAGLVARAAALLDKDERRLLATADAFEAAGSRYQAARTLVLAGGGHATRGAAALAGLGLTS